MSVGSLLNQIPNTSGAASNLLGNAISGINNAIGVANPVKGVYRTVIPTPFSSNTGGPALFRLSIYDPNTQKTLTSSIPENPFVFAVSPQDYSRRFAEMTTIYDTPGTAKQRGVQRVADQYGEGPPIWTFRGTTGYTYHNFDNYKNTGMQAINNLRNFLSSFALLNKSQADNGLELYTMEMDDFYQGEYWQVVPMGQQSINRNSSKPLWGYYDITLAGITSVTSPVTQTDPILQALEVPFETALQTAGTFGAGVIQGLYPSSIANFLLSSSGALSFATAL